MLCPYCRSEEDKVVDTRSSEGGAGIRRRRECLNCGKRFTSYERLEEIPVMVIKNSGQREAFAVEKVIRSVEIACRKRPVAAEQIRDLAERVEMQALQSKDRTIASSSIGDFIIQELKQLDTVALVRFASVYRNYKNLDQFSDFIQSLKSNVEVG